MKNKFTAGILAAAVTITGSLAGTAVPVLADDPLDIVVQTTYPMTTMDNHLITSMAEFRVTYEGLYKYDANGVIVPGLAESVDISEDGLTYTFKIRDDAYYNNGLKVTADDFVFGWKRLINPDTGASYANLPYTAGVKNAGAILNDGADVDTLGITAVDESTLVVELERPVPYFPNLLIQPQFFPVNEEFYNSVGDEYGLGVDYTLSAGPLYLSEWEPGGNTIVFAKNEYYYDADAIEVDTLTFEAIGDNQQAIFAWESGAVDEISLTSDLVELYADDPAFDPQLVGTMYYISPNTLVPGLENENLRLAIALAFDKQEIVDALLKNGSLPANYIIPENFALDENGVSFRDAAGKYYLESDKELALAYYEKAKEELGTDTFSFEFLHDDTETLSIVAQFIQSEIENTLPGVTLTLKSQPKANRNQLLRDHDYELCLAWWGPDYQDATTFLDLWTSSSSFDFGSYSSEAYDGLLAKVYGEDAADGEARLRDLIDAEEVLLSEAGIIPVYQGANAFLLNPDLDVIYTDKGYQWQLARRK